MLTLPPGLQVGVMDGVLSAVEVALLDLGAARIWIDPDQSALTVMADLPDYVLATPQCRAKDGTK